MGVVKEMIAGAVAGLAGDIALHPIDVIKVRQQTQKPNAAGEYKYKTMKQSAGVIYKEEGIRGIYSGLGATTLLSVPSSAALFASYYYARKWLVKTFVGVGRIPSAGQSLVCSLLAGSFSELFSTPIAVPLELVKVRMQTQARGLNTTGGKRYLCSLHCLYDVVKTEGVKRLFAGIVPTLLRNIPASAIQFATYEFLQSILLRRKRNKGVEKPQLTVGESMVIGTVAGAVCAAATAPLDLLNSRRALENAPLGQVVKKIWKEEGLRGFLHGAGSRVGWIAPNFGVAYFALTATKQFMG